MSADGKIASPIRKQIRISCEEDLKRMYRLRNECDAVLVGIGTILIDDPKLTVKEPYVRHANQPLRVILDSNARTPSHASALNDAAKTLIITAKGKKKPYPQSHVEVVECDTDSRGLIDVMNALSLLYQKGIRKLLVEGGGTVIWNFLKNRVVDDLFIFIGPCIADGEGITDGEEIALKIKKVKRLGSGVLIHYCPV